METPVHSGHSIYTPKDTKLLHVRDAAASRSSIRKQDCMLAAPATSSEDVLAQTAKTSAIGKQICGCESKVIKHIVPRPAECLSSHEPSHRSRRLSAPSPSSGYRARR